MNSKDLSKYLIDSLFLKFISAFKTYHWTQDLYDLHFLKKNCSNQLKEELKLNSITSNILELYYKSFEESISTVPKNKNPKKAIKLDPEICRSLGIGNSTGLGMAPFIVNHPTLLSNWISARETSLKKIREIRNISNEEKKLFLDCLKKSIKNIISWNTKSEYQILKIKWYWNEIYSEIFHDLKKIAKRNIEI